MLMNITIDKLIENIKGFVSSEQGSSAIIIIIIIILTSYIIYTINQEGSFY